MPKREQKVVGIVGSNLTHARDRLGISQEELAAAMGIKTNNIGRWERGEVDPSGYYVRMMASELETTSDYLLGLSDDVNDHVEMAPLTSDQRHILWLIDHGLTLNAIALIVGLPQQTE